MTLTSPETQSPERISTYRRRLLRLGLVETAQMAAELHTDLLEIAQFDIKVGPNFPLTYRLAGFMGSAGKIVHARLGDEHDVFLNSDGVHTYGAHVSLAIKAERSFVKDESRETVQIWDTPERGGRAKRSLGLAAYIRTPADYDFTKESQVDLITSQENGYANDPEAHLDLIRADLKTLETWTHW